MAKVERSAGGQAREALLISVSRLPIYEDLNSTEAWEKYGINDVEVGFSALSFRVSDGDDASCLNLNRAQRPRLLGVQTDLIAEIKEAKRDIAENPSEEAWRRFLALKRQKMEEAMDEQAE